MNDLKVVELRDDIVHVSTVVWFDDVAVSVGTLTMVPPEEVEVRELTHELGWPWNRYIAAYGVELLHGERVLSRNWAHLPNAAPWERIVARWQMLQAIGR